MTLPANLKTIDSSAFANCSALTRISIPSSVTHLGDNVFWDCSNLSSVTLNNGLKEIGSGAFFGTAIMEITIPYTVESMNSNFSYPASCFYGAESLKKVIFAEGMTTIPYSALGVTESYYYWNEDHRDYYYCSSVEEVVLPSTVQTISDYAFYGCTGLKSITLPTNLKTISYYAFGNTGLPFIHVPASVTSIGDSAFYNHSASFYICCDQADCYAKTYADENEIEFRLCGGHTPQPQTYTVTFHGNGATSGSMSNQTFTYGVAQNLTANAYERAYTVTYNYNGATDSNSESSANATATFNGWATSASGVKVYDNKQSVKDLATSGTVDLYANWTLGSVLLPTPQKTGFTFGGWYANSELTQFVGDEGASYIPIENVHLYAKWTETPATLTSVSVNTMPTKTVYIVGEDFDASGLTLLASYSDGSTKTISSGFNCTPARLNIVGQQTITVTYQDKTATLAVTVNPISNIVSGVCGAQGDNLTWTLNLDTGVMIITGTGKMDNYDRYHSSNNGPWKEYISNIKELIIENGVETIGDYAFCDCTYLKSVSLSDSVIVIGRFSFDTCIALTDITIPESVTSIGRYAFNWCTSLAHINIPDSVISVGGAAFHSTAFYSNATNWSNDVLYINHCLIEARTTSSSFTIKTGTLCIAEGAFTGGEKIRDITIPDSVTNIGDIAFALCDNLSDVYYIGTQDQWKRIDIGIGNEKLTSATIHFIGEPEADLVSIAVTKKPTKAIYDIGEPLDTAGIVITATYSDGSTKTISASSCTFTGFDSGSAGVKTVTVTYQRKTDTFNVTVRESVPTSNGQIYVDPAKGYIGQRFDVTIRLQNNPGLVAARLEIGYDANVLKLVDAKNGEVITGGSFITSQTFETNPYVAMWHDSTARVDYTADGVLLTLTFEVLETAEAGTTEITVNYEPDATFNQVLQNQALTMHNGTVEITERVVGDADGDGVLNLKDVVVLRRMLAGWEGYSINDTNADVDGDGKVTLKDAVLLERYLAGWDVTLK